MYLIYLGLPMLVAGGTIGVFTNVVAQDNPQLMPIGTLIGTLLIMAGALLYGQKYLQFYWANITIEGKRANYTGTIGGLFAAVLPWLGVSILSQIIGAFTFGAGTLLSLVVFPWFYRSVKRFVYSNVDLQGERLQFNADPAQLLGIYILGMIITICTLGIYAPWWVNNIYEWDWNGTSVSGRPFRFNKDPGGLFGNWIVVMLLTMCTFGIYSPWGICSMVRWETEHVS
jgi:uncharacterized membrane protein YjgN (DUF898 family)